MLDADRIREFGREAAARFESRGRAPAVFSALATDLLRTARLHEAIDPDVLLAELAGAADLGPQMDLTTRFATPPVTVFQNDDFYIDVYFWLAPRTGVHSHGFTGAFTVLRGVSLHNVYTFDHERDYAGDVVVGRLCRAQTELLRAGDVRTIHDGQAFIHQVAHLSCPSVSLIVRNRFSGSDPAIFAYLAPEIGARSSSHLSAATPLRKLQIARFLVESRHPRSDELVATMVAAATPLAAFWMLIEFSLATQDLERTTRLVESVGASRPPWTDSLLRSLAHESRVSVDWTRLRDEGQRLFASLAASVEDPAVIRRMITDYAPGRPVSQTVLEWVQSMRRGGIVDFDLNPTAEHVLEVYLTGGSEADACRALSARFQVAAGSDLARDVRAFSEELAANPFLAPFVPDPPYLSQG